MKRVFLGLLASTLIVSGCGIVSGATKQTQPKPEQPNIKQIFLNYVPPNEPVAPHDMEYLVEHSAGDGGYYGTKYFPGNVSIKKVTNTEIAHYKTEESTSLSGNVKTKQIQTGTTKVWNNTIWSINWNINGSTFSFMLYQQLKGDHNWSVEGQNQNGILALSFQ